MSVVGKKWNRNSITLRSFVLFKKGEGFIDICGARSMDEALDMMDGCYKVRQDPTANYEVWEKSYAEKAGLL